MRTSRKQRTKKNVVEGGLPMPALEMTTTKKAFGKHLENFMRDRGLSQSDFAAAIWGRNPDTGAARKRDLVSSYVTGQTFPTRETLAFMAEQLRVKIEELIPASLGPKTDVVRDKIKIEDAGNGMVDVTWIVRVPRHVADRHKDLEDLTEKLKRAPNYHELRDHFAELAKAAVSRKSA